MRSAITLVACVVVALSMCLSCDRGDSSSQSSSARNQASESHSQADRVYVERSVSAPPVDPLLEAWSKRVESLDLTALAKAMAESAGTSNAWPTMKYREPVGGPGRGRMPIYPLAERLFAKIESVEWAEYLQDPSSRDATAQAYTALAAQLRLAGGYANLLVADALDRMSMVHFVRRLVSDPSSAPRVRSMLQAIASPTFTPEALSDLVWEVSNPKSPTTHPAAGDTRPWAANGMLVEQYFNPTARLLAPQDQLSSEAYNRGLQGFMRTRWLLSNPNAIGLVNRAIATDRMAIFTVPMFLEFAEKGGKWEPKRDVAFAQFARIFGSTEREVKDPRYNPSKCDASSFFAMQCSAMGMRQADETLPLEPLVQPWPDLLYAQVIDPAPARPKDSQFVLSVKEAPLGQAEEWTQNIEASSNGKSWAARDMIPAPPPAPGAPRRPVGPPQRNAQAIINGKRGNVYASINGHGAREVFAFSPAGDRVAYVAGARGDERVVLDGVEGKTFDEIAAETLRFSYDGKTLVFVAERARQRWVIVNGNEFGPYEFIFDIVMSDNGSPVVWSARPAGRKPTFVIVVDGKAGPPMTTKPSNLVISRDGKRWAYTNGSVTQIDGANPTSFNNAEPPLAFSPDAQHLLSSWPGATIATSPGALILDGQTVMKFTDAIFIPPSFSPDGKSIRVSSESRSVVVSLDGHVLTDQPKQTRFSPHSDRIVTVTRMRYNQRRQVEPTVYDLGGGNVLKPYGQTLFETFLPDDRFLFTSYEKNQHVLVVEGEESVQYWSLPPKSLGFSADGQHFAIVAGRCGIARFLVDGQETAESYDQTAGVPCCFTSPNQFRSIAFRNGQMYAVEVTISGSPRQHTLPPATQASLPSDSGN